MYVCQCVCVCVLRVCVCVCVCVCYMTWHCVCMQKLHYALIRDKFRKAGAAVTIQNFFRETIRSVLPKPMI